MQAADVEYQKLKNMNAWTPVKRKTIEEDHKSCKGSIKPHRCPKHQILPLRWVFTYKVDENGYLSKFKARICVREDLQVDRNDETRATTLAARTLRTLLAIIAAFDLETIQLDAVNAFLNSKLDDPVYVAFPQGYGRKHYVLRLNKALYGLRVAPILWQQEVLQKLAQFGFVPIPEDPCLFVYKNVVLMIFVDDILVIFHRRHKHEAHELRDKLMQAYEMKDLGEATRFIGIRITRDRATKRLWISQDAYIEKIAHRFHITPLKPVKTPFPPSPLPAPPSDHQASPAMIHLYQQKIGSLLYATIMTRPDAAKATQMLSEHLTNPTNQHMDAADKAIAYLYYTRYKAIEYSPVLDGPTFACASDASYADNIGRKSSEGYVAYLFNGPIDWIARKQKTVTTSTTEAELLAISSASKHVMWWKRLFRSIELDLDQERLSVLCDNKQTVDLLTKVNSLFRTKLRHIDIHHHWLRQEIVAGNIDIAWIETNSMPADGLTKPLPYHKHQRFIDHLNMTDIQDRIVEI
ncbi:uncharacterized protein N7477_008984 [Penicillium maclennaniae]|uniref:uncharacterized protein n=1 Tax=Penicillium maclennaniae TaxID=1343394 RepID=UPI00254092D8|nr:uncharacterized protein N7477_008984 [Penicillium maclennaniae]KAJ5666536.1 hypothetical protein N7477_008984 [Penicillium maclennaniae]